MEDLSNVIALWKGAVEPAESGPSGNEYQAWKGAVEPPGPRIASGSPSIAKPTSGGAAEVIKIASGTPSIAKPTSAGGGIPEVFIDIEIIAAAGGIDITAAAGGIDITAAVREITITGKAGRLN